jgi:F-type H+-transporting ATPase subunit delta
MKTSRRTRHQAKRLFRLCCTDGLLDEGRAQQLLQRFLHAQPRGALAVLTEFLKLVKADRAQHIATVESAAPLSTEASTRISARLNQAYGPGLNISFAHNPALLGGIRVTVGSDVYDGSVQGRLAALQQRFS